MSMMGNIDHGGRYYPLQWSILYALFLNGNFVLIYRCQEIIQEKLPVVPGQKKG